MDSGFIVSGGRISSNPSALSGSVDSGGTVSFTRARANRTGSGGNYRDSQGLDGTWSVVRVSGGSSGSGGSGIIGIVEAVLNFMYSFSFIGEAIGLSGTLAASVGTAAVILVFVIGITAVTSAGSRRRKSGVMQRKRGEGGRIISKVNYDLDRQGEYEVSPGESSGTHEIPASSIDVPPGPLHPPVGLHVERPALPDRFDLRSVWSNNGVRFDWETPDFDPEKFELMGYEVFQMYYDGSSTVPSLRPPTRLTADYTS